MSHLIVHSEAPQGSAEWLEARNAGLGSTDASAALGVSPWKPLSNYGRRSAGLKEGPVDNFFMARGRAMEPVLRQHYADKFGREVVQIPGTLKHPEYEFMIASLDGITREDERITEFKTASSRKGWGEAGSDEVPQNYLIQVQHAMIVTGTEVADIGVSFAGGEPEYYEVPADKELHEMIIEGERAFWDKVKNAVEPEPTTLEEMQKKYRVNDEQGVVATEAIIQQYNALLTVREESARAKAAEDNIKQTIQKFLLEQGGAILVDQQGNPLVTWKEGKGRETFDTKTFKGMHADLYRQFVKIGSPSRRFLVK